MHIMIIIYCHMPIRAYNYIYIASRAKFTNKSYISQYWMSEFDSLNLYIPLEF